MSTKCQPRGAEKASSALTVTMPPVPTRSEGLPLVFGPAREKELGKHVARVEREELLARLRDEVEVVAVTRCALCPAWTFTGSPAEGRRAFERHALGKRHQARLTGQHAEAAPG
jgi:hypothetical protein